MPSGWDNPLEMPSQQSQMAVPGVKKKIKRRRNLQLQASKRGDFEKRISKIGDAPNLMSVVTAKSSIKERAVKEAVQRDQKNAKKKLAGRRKIVKKHPVKQRDNQWTTLSGKKVSSVSKKIVTKKPKRRPSSDSKSSFSSSRASSSWTKPISSSSPMSEDVKSVSSGKKKKKKKVKAKVIPTFVSQHSGDLASLAEKKGGGGSSQSINLMDQSAHTIKSNGSLQNSNNKQILLEFDMPDMGGMQAQLSVDLETVGDMSSIESWPSIRSDDTPETKMNKMMQRWMDLNIEFDDDDENDKEAEAAAAAAAQEEEPSGLEDNCLDHIILASPKMKDALDTFEKLTGVRPVVMGPLEGLGIQTAQVPMDGGRFIEIIAPDDTHPGPLSDELKTLPRGRVIPYQYAIRATEISRLIEGYVYDVLGWDPDHICMVQTLPNKKIRQWDLLTMYGHNIGGAAPIYVKYPGEHPTTKLGEPQITFKSFFVQADRDHRVHKLITDVGGIDIEYGQVPALEFEFDTPKGGRALSNNYPAGLIFPGFKAVGDKKSKSSSSSVSVKKKKKKKKEKP